MILHISYDQKFIDNVIKQFEAVSEDNNIYLILVDNKESGIKQILSKNYIQIHERRSFDINQYLNKNNNISGVLFHSLSPARAKLLLQIKKNIKTGWMCWGTEMYSNPRIIKKELIQKQTKRITRISRFSSLPSYLLSAVNDIAYFLKEGFVSKNLMMKKAIHRVNYCMPVFKEDYDLLKENLPEFNANFLAFNYGYLDLFIGKSQTRKVSGNNILIGNSATPYNNHIEILNKLKTFKNINRYKLILPLSYGDNNYANKVNHLGDKYFKQNYKGLNSVLPLNEYLEILSQCGYVIMNHNRQQGLGNIIALIWQGAKVFLNKKTTTWDFFERIGVKVFSIEYDLTNDSLTPLSAEIIIKNRKAIEIEYSKKIVLQRTKEIFSIFSE